MAFSCSIFSLSSIFPTFGSWHFSPLAKPVVSTLVSFSQGKKSSRFGPGMLQVWARGSLTLWIFSSRVVATPGKWRYYMYYCMCFLFCLGGIFRFLIVFWMFVAKYSKYLPQNSKFCRSLWEVIISNHLNWNSNTSPNSKFGCFEIVCVTKCNLDAGQIAKPWRSKDLKPAPNMISEIPQALQLPKRTLQLNVLDSYDTLRLATRFIGAPGGIGCRVMESEEWRGMEKSLLFFCRVWDVVPLVGDMNHHKSYDAQFRVIKKLSMK